MRGWVKVQSFTENVEDILTYSTWQLQENEGFRSLEIEAGRPYGKGVIVKFRGIDSPEKVRELAGRQVVIPRSALPDTGKDEYYWADLEGLAVIDQHGRCLGKVGWMIQTGSTDAMVVEDDEGHQIAIPWLQDTVILRVSLESGEIFVNWDPL